MIDAVPLFLTYLLTVALLTVTPGLDTALILRVTAIEGRPNGMRAALGVALGCLIWGAAAATGIGALVSASHLAYDVIRYVGAAYLLWLGANLLMRPGHSATAASASEMGRQTNWFLRGVIGNVTNPKVGVFYAAFLPQFCPRGFSLCPTMLALTLVHVALGLLWALVLISLGERISVTLRRPGPAKWIDRLTGSLFIGFGLRLALDRR